jgi:hypothetical protein
VPVGRKKKHNKHLPRGVTPEHGAYYFRGPHRKRVRLGAAMGEALAQWAALVQPDPGAITTLHDAFERYKLKVVPKKPPKTQQGYPSMPATFRRRASAARRMLSSGAAWRGALLGIFPTMCVNDQLRNQCLRVGKKRTPRKRKVTTTADRVGGLT